jgi:hypothetical protein
MRFETRHASAWVAMAILVSGTLGGASAFAQAVATGAGNPAARVSVDQWMTAPGSGCRRGDGQVWLCDKPVRIIDARDRVIDGGGVVIRFTDMRRGAGGLQLERARNVALRALTIEWSEVSPTGVPLHAVGKVSRCDGAVDGGRLELDTKFTAQGPVGSISVWDRVKGWPWSADSPDVPETSFPEGTTTGFERGVSGCLPRLAAMDGKTVLTRLFRGNHAFTCIDCQDFTLEQVTVHSAPGMAFVFDRNARNVVVRGNHVTPPCGNTCAQATPSTTGDGLHISGAQGPILVEANDFGWQGDDAVNINGLLVPGSFPDIDAGGDGLVNFKADKTWSGRLSTWSVGDAVSVYDMGMKRLAGGRIESIDGPAGQVGMRADRPVKGRVAVAVDRLAPKDVVIRNNHFHDHRARGILLGAQSALIEGNLIERVTMQAIVLNADTDRWFEGPPPRDVTVRNNKIRQVNRYPDRDYPAAISVGVKTCPCYKEDQESVISGLRIHDNDVSDINGRNPEKIHYGSGVAAGGSAVKERDAEIRPLQPPRCGRFIRPRHYPNHRGINCLNGLPTCRHLKPAVSRSFNEAAVAESRRQL